MNNYPYNNNQGSGYNYNSQYSPSPQYSAPTPEPPKKNKKKIWPIVTASVAGVVAGAVAMGAFFGPQLAKKDGNVFAPAAEQTEGAETSPAVSNQLGGDAVEIQNSGNPVVEIAENAGKSVVGVTVYSKSYVSGREPIEQDVSAGTGFVISPDGLILTNHHVIEGGNGARVKTMDGDEYEAEIVGSDPNTEVAVLRVPELNLPALALGNSDEAKTGELVVAIGNPIRAELSGTVTVGYLSGTKRPMQLAGNGSEVEMLQTDTAINPGNSGGPLLNSKGEVIGINTMKTLYAGMDAYGQSIDAEGIGFAIPINTATTVAQQIIETGSVPLTPRPGIGFTYQPVDAQDAQMWGVPQGAMIASVIPGSPADRAGLRQYDVIIMLDGVDVSNGAELPSFEGKQVGDKVSATIWRDGNTADVEFTLVDLNDFE